MRSIALGLSHHPSTSKYGFGCISDYDLFFVCNTADKINKFCKEKNIVLSAEEMLNYSKDAKCVYQFVTGIRREVFQAFELPGTPPSKKMIVKADKDKKKIYSEDDIKEKLVKIGDIKRQERLNGNTNMDTEDDEVLEDLTAETTQELGKKKRLSNANNIKSSREPCIPLMPEGQANTLAIRSLFDNVGCQFSEFNKGIPIIIHWDKENNLGYIGFLPNDEEIKKNVGDFAMFDFNI